jgi:hypothetical protein
MKDDHGNTLLTHKEIMNELTYFYKDLLLEPSVDLTPTIDRVTQNIPFLISVEQSDSLMRPITQLELDQEV